MLANLIVGICDNAGVPRRAGRHHVLERALLHTTIIQRGGTAQFLVGIRPLLIAMLIMVAGNFIQIIVWGILFLMLGELDELYEAIYHSAVNFASLGYGDFVMSKNRKLLGPLEAVNGVIMFGMTSAALMVILQQIIKDQQDEVMASARRSTGRDGSTR